MPDEQGATRANSPPLAAPTQGASQFAISISAVDILITVGHSRVAMLQNPAGQLTPQPFQEWFMTLAVSPSAAVLLSEQLKSAIATYETSFGTIPRDPNFRITVSLPSGAEPKA